jgi:O-antigen ligase
MLYPTKVRSFLIGTTLIIAIANGVLYYDSYRVALIIFSQLGIAAVILRESSPPWHRYLLAAVLITSTLLYFFGGLSEGYWLPELGFYAYYLVALFWVVRSRVVENIIHTIDVSAFLYGIASVYVFVALLIDFASLFDVVNVPRTYFLPWGFENIRYWSHVATWLVPVMSVALAVSGDTLSKKARRSMVLVCALWWWIILLSIARGTMLGLFTGAIAVMVFAPAVVRRDYLKCFFTPFFLGIVLWLLLEFLIPWLVFGEVAHKSLNITTSGRIPQWKEAFAMSLQNFPFGMGVQSWLTHEVITDTYRVRFGHPHNMYLLWAAEYGWLFVASLFAGAMWILRRSFARVRGLALNDPKRALILLALLHSFIAACTHAGVSAVFIGPASLLVGWFVMVAILRMTFPVTGDRRDLIARPVPLWLRGSLALLLLWSFAAYWDALLDYKRDSDKDQICYPYMGIPTGNGPRFWLHGDFPRPPSLACDENRIPEDVRRALD